MRLATETWVAAVASAPLVLMYPLFLVIFGRSAWTIIMIAFVSALPPVILKTLEGLTGTRAVLINVGRSFNLTPSQLYWKILFPAALPTIFVGVRLGMIFALINIVGVEFLINFGGLGQLVNELAERYDLPGNLRCDLLRHPGQRIVLHRHRTDRAMAQTGHLTRAPRAAAPWLSPVTRLRIAYPADDPGDLGGRRCARESCCATWCLRLVTIGRSLAELLFHPDLKVSSAGSRFSRSRAFYWHLYVTILEVATALVIGGIAGLAVGLALGANPFLARAFERYLYYLGPTPKIVFFPVMIMWFGVGPESKIAMGTLSASSRSCSASPPACARSRAC